MYLRFSRIFSTTSALCCLMLIATAAGAQRIALVVGVNDYERTDGLPDLNNAVSDAAMVAEELTKAGFIVSLLRDPDSKELKKAIRDLQPAEDLVFYFAGHGIQQNERNALLGSDGSVDFKQGAVNNGVAISAIVDELSGDKPDNLILFLDCCREIPGLRGEQPSMLRAVLRHQYPGIVICYSASPGSVARDGEGQNGPFATALARYIAGNAELAQLLKNVTNEVTIKTAKGQVPYVAGSLGKDFYFRDANENDVVLYRSELVELDVGKLGCVSIAVESLREFCRPADDPTRSLLIAEFLAFRERVFDRFNEQNYELLGRILESGVEDRDRGLELGTWDSWDDRFNSVGAWIRPDGEGGGFLAGRPNWLEGKLARLIPVEWLEYLQMENRSVEKLVALDAALMIGYDELVSRIIEREEFLIKYYTFPLRVKVEERLDWELRIFLFGIDNSPISPGLNMPVHADYLASLERYIEESDPVWRGREDAIRHREALRKANDRLTPQVVRSTGGRAGHESFRGTLEKVRSESIGGSKSMARVRKYKVVGVDRGARLNVRADAGIHNRIIGQLESSAKGVQITGGSKSVGEDSWVPITWRGIAGYVNVRYLKEVDSLDSEADFEALRMFLTRFLESDESTSFKVSTDTSSSAAFFEFPVEIYYDKKNVSEREYEKAHSKYLRAWPKRRYKFIDGPRLTGSVRDSDKMVHTLVASISYELESSTRRARGENRVQYRIVEMRSGSLMIRGVKELGD